MGAATRGALWTVVSAISFMFANVLIKHLSTKLPALEMALFRGAGGILLAAIAWRAFLHLRQLRDPWWHMARAGVGAISLMALVHAYANLPIALVTGVMYLRVLLVIPLQRLILGETADRRAWVAACIGIAGALVALWPRLITIGTPQWSWAVGSLIVAAFAGAGSQICMRRLAMTNPPTVVVAVAAVLITAIVAVPASTVSITPPPGDLPWLIGMSLLSAVAQWASVSGYRYAGPAVLMPVTLIDIPLALVSGLLLFGEVPSLESIVGASMIIGSAVFVTMATGKPESR